jgi:hypothetical protein
MCLLVNRLKLSPSNSELLACELLVCLVCLWFIPTSRSHLQASLLSSVNSLHQFSPLHHRHHIDIAMFVYIPDHHMLRYEANTQLAPWNLLQPQGFPSRSSVHSPDRKPFRKWVTAWHKVVLAEVHHLATRLTLPHIFQIPRPFYHFTYLKHHSFVITRPQSTSDPPYTDHTSAC